MMTQEEYDKLNEFDQISARFTRDALRYGALVSGTILILLESSLVFLFLFQNAVDWMIPLFIPWNLFYGSIGFWLLYQVVNAYLPVFKL